VSEPGWVPHNWPHNLVATVGFCPKPTATGSLWLGVRVGVRHKVCCKSMHVTPRSSHAAVRQTVTVVLHFRRPNCQHTRPLCQVCCKGMHRTPRSRRAAARQTMTVVRHFCHPNRRHSPTVPHAMQRQEPHTGRKPTHQTNIHL
jgi:hypothetical protein